MEEENKAVVSEVCQDSPEVGHEDSAGTGNDKHESEGTVSVTYHSPQDDDEEGEEELPFPGFVPVAFRCLDQHNRVRFWCLRTITWPYPFIIVVVSYRHSRGK